MWTRRGFAGLLLTIVAPGARGAEQPVAASAAANAPPPPNARARDDELATLRAFAESTHPRGRQAAADPDWQARWRAAAAARTDGEYLVRVRRALAWFHDGHTTVLPFEFTGGVPAALASGPFALALPLRIEVFHDGAHVVAAGPAARALLGCRIERIGALGVADLMRRIAETWPGNAAWAQRWAGGVLASPAQLQALGVLESPDAPVEIVATPDAGRSHANVRLAPARSGATLEPLARTPAARERWGGGVANYVQALGNGCVYACIDEMADVDGRSFESLTRAVFDALDAPDTRRLIVDLRRNGGGNNYFGEALRKRIARSRVNRPGGLYVLAGPRTFSAAQNLASRLERETFARFVGEPTGGAPNHYGDARPLVGEATGLTTIVSTLAWFDSYPQDSRPWILPDVPVPETYADFVAGRDPALDAARTEAVDAPADELDRERIFYFRRRSQSRDWRPFWREA